VTLTAIEKTIEMHSAVAQNLETGAKAYLLVDGDCGICTAFADWAKKLDRNKEFKIVPYQIFSEEELCRFGTSRQKCAQRMHALTSRGKIFTGAFALNYFGWRFLPWRVLALVIYLVPVLLLLEVILYELVAKHRHRLSQWLGLQACAPRGAFPQPLEEGK
jgi:predicted DCC family thiol-disulfide oxidoreductase YuxK